MGQTILQLANAGEVFDIAGEVDMGDDLSAVIDQADVVIDFSHHLATLNVAQLAAKAGKALIIGTTGHADAEKKKIVELSSKIPMIFTSNYSVGVNVLFFLTRKAAEILGENYDQEVVEMHHRMKKDSPSGTAKSLVEILCDVKNKSYAELAKHGRVGDVGPRTPSEIGVHALRGGDVVGDHTVMFATEGERVELTHKLSSRNALAGGALRAAQWLVDQKPGFYTMADVLGLKEI